MDWERVKTTLLPGLSGLFIMWLLCVMFCMSPSVSAQTSYPGSPMPMSAGSWPGDAMGDQQVSVMGVNELTDLMKSNMSFLLVDARPRDQYDRAHIPGAISVPLNDIPACASQMDKSQPIVTYCGNYHCPISTKAAVAFMKLGFINVRDYKGGIKELQELGYPTAYT